MSNVLFSAAIPAGAIGIQAAKALPPQQPKFEGFMRDYFIETPKDLWRDGGMGKAMAGLWYAVNAALIGVIGLVGVGVGQNIHQHNQAATFEKACTEISSPVSRTDCILPGFNSENAYIRQFSIQMIPAMTIGEQAKAELYAKALRDPSHSVYRLVREEIAKYLDSGESSPLRDLLRQLNAEAPELYTTSTTTLVMVGKVMVPQTTTTTHRKPYSERYRQLETELLAQVKQAKQVKP